MNFQRKMNACSILSNADWTKRGVAPLFSSKCTMPSSTARWRTQRAEFSLYTTASKKSIGKLHKKSCFGSPEIVQLFSKKFLTSGVGGGILFTEVKRGAPKGFQKDFEKNRKNLLTNSVRHDIIGTEVKGKRFLKRRKATVKKLPKNFKNLLTSQAKSAIMKAQGNPMHLEKSTSYFGIKLPKV